MQLSQSQLAHFNQLKLEKFILLTIDFIRANFQIWATAKDDDELKGYISSMIKWAGEYGIQSELSIQKLVHYNIAYGWEKPLDVKLEVVLERPNQDEKNRVEEFCLLVASGHYKLVEFSFDSDLNSLLKKQDKK